MDLVKSYETFLSIRRASDFEFNESIEYGEHKLTALGLRDFAYVDFSNFSTNELINSINTFGYYIISLRAWKQTLNQLKPDMTDQLSLQMEFIEPLLTCAINCPYAIKNQYVFTAVKLIQIAHPLPEHQIPEDRDINFQYLKKLLTPDSSHDTLLSALRKIDTTEFQKTIGNIRHLSHHRIPRNYEVGIIPNIKVYRNLEGKKEIEVGILKPMPISICIEALHQQHTEAQLLLKIFWNFVLDQHQIAQDLFTKSIEQ